MGINYSPKIVTDGLVLALDAANPKSYPGSGTTWFDLSGNGNNGTLVNGVGYSGDNLGSLVFDGVNDNVPTSLTQSFNELLTVECWYKGTKNTRNHLWNFSGNNLNCDFNDGTYPLWMYWNGSGGNRVRYNGTFTDGNIKHLVFTHSGSTNKVFLNGVELPIAESAGTQSFSNIGTSGFNVGITQPFGGNIYTLRVYETSLTSQEIQQNFNSLRGRYGI
jgi:hypothetical protein